MVEPFLTGDVQKKSSGLFKKPVTTGPGVADVMQQLNSVDSRVKLLEARFNDIGRRIGVIEKNMLSERKMIANEIKVIDSEELELKRQINEAKNQIELIVADLKSCSRKDDFEALRRYIDLWEPMNFVTRNEVDKIIEEKLAEKSKSNK